MNLLLAVIASLRLTRFVTTDYLGHWWFVRPARLWALPESAKVGWVDGAGKPSVPDVDVIWASLDPTQEGKRVKLVKGLDCPYCVGFWIGVAVLLSLAIVRAVPPLLPLWRFAMGALALNYIVGHVSAKIDV